MGSSEEYLDSLLDSILGGGDVKESSPEKSEETVSEENSSVEAGKAMSPAEIEEMLASMGALDGGEKATETDTAADDMEAMLAFMNEQSDVIDDASATEEAVVEDMSGEELSLDDFSMEEIGVDDSIEADLGLEELPEGDLSLDEMPMEETPMEDLSLDEMLMEETPMEDMSVDEMPIEDLSTEELSLEDFSMEETGMDDSIEADLGLEEFPEGELSLEETPMEDLSLDEMLMEETPMEDMSVDEMPIEDMSVEETPVEDLSTEELSLDELSMEETEMDDSIEADLGLGELPEGELSVDEMPIEELSLDELSLDDLSLDEETTEETADSASEDFGDEDMDGLMSEEDIDRLLNGDSMGEEETASEDFALEETGDGEEELSDLLAGMDHDEDLSEINDLLEESQQGVSADDDLLAMLEGTSDGDDDPFDFFESDEAAREAEGIRELSPEEVAARENKGEGKSKKEKKKRKKLFGKKKDEADAVAEGAEGGLEDAAEQETEKKPGIFAKLMDLLLESDEDPLEAEVLGDNGGATGMVTDENQALLDELSEEDKKGKKKKKKEKKKKDKKEDEEKEKKPKKPKKEKKKKEAPAADPFAPPEKKLSKKKVFTVFLFCGTLGAGIIVLTSYLPDYLQIQDAHVAYDNNEYAEVYDLLYGIERSEQDEILFQRSNLILQMRRKVASYENYVNLNMRLEALNALISGVERYQKILPEAEKYNVVDEVSTTYSQILGLLSMDFGVSESEALEIISLKDDVEYTQWLEGILNGNTYSEEEETGATLDILPEEEEILERLEGLQEEQQDIMPDEEIVIDDVTPENWDEGSEE